MGRTMGDLLVEAKELNIPVEGLKYNELRSAIKSKKDISKTSTSNDQEDNNKDSQDTVQEKSQPEADKEEETPNPTVLRHLEAKAQRKKNAKKAKKAKQVKEAKADEQKASGENSSSKKKKDNRPMFEDDRGLKFRFKRTAPKSLNIDGKSTPIADIIKNEEVMLELVYGNSNFIEQIYS